MKQRPVQNEQQLQQACTDLLRLGGHLPFVITVTEGKRIRTSAQNARYWLDMEFFLSEIRESVYRLAEHTGYTDAETRWVIAEELPVEQRAILFCLSKEAAHEVIKQICGIPTSTRLGTKDFMRFEERLAQTMSEILGQINAITARAAA